MESWGPSGGDWIELPPPGIANLIAGLPGRGVLGELALDHVGIAVRDVEEAVERFSALLGLHDWKVSTIEMPVEFQCAEQLTGARIAYGQMGPIQLELVQPTKGSWTPADFLEKRGEGMYHFGFRVPDVAAAIAGAEGAGLRIGTLGVDQGGPPLVAYTEPDDLFGVSLEFVGPVFPQSMLKSFEEIR